MSRCDTCTHWQKVEHETFDYGRCDQHGMRITTAGAQTCDKWKGAE